MDNRLVVRCQDNAVAPEAAFVNTAYNAEQDEAENRVDHRWSPGVNTVVEEQGAACQVTLKLTGITHCVSDVDAYVSHFGL